MPVLVLINQNLNESSTFLNDNHARLSQKNMKSERPFQQLTTIFYSYLKSELQAATN